jgi:hypothetical protein
MAALPPFGRKMEYPVGEIYINSKHAKKNKLNALINGIYERTSLIQMTKFIFGEKTK